MSSPEVRRNIMFLSLCVALSASAMSLIFTVAAVIGYSLRSEEHTSELQSHHELVCCLLLEKKKTKKIKPEIPMYLARIKK